MAGKLRVGILNDMANAPEDHTSDLTQWLEREVARVQHSGRLDAEVEFVHAWGLGLPAGTAEAVERAFMELVRQDVVLIAGPAIGDNALLATPWVERERVPTINWAGAERARGEWMFHLQVGSHEDESLVIARHMRKIGCTRLGVIHDQSPIGTRHLAYLQDECAIIGLAIGSVAGISPLADDASGEVAHVLGCAPDGFVYFGLGLSAPAVAHALAASGWQGPRIMNTAGLRGYQPDFARAIDGWTYIDMQSDGNSTLAALKQELGIATEQAVFAAVRHDLGRLVAEGLARARDPTREGVRLGLEQVKWLPAAEGMEGTLLGFGIRDRGALHGRYLVVRRWQGGKTVEVEG
ncbi:MAG: ABC transporter substrate-binding protein [Novosphingobium sp.]|nr:ABC transporter substrate-binding protein [Novosphingobium sp.]